MARVLVVDDDAANRDLVSTLLGYHGHTVVQACDGAEGLSSARRDLPDLIITDLVMPVMDGYELLREIRADERLASIPAIFYTANYLETEAQPIATALGVRHVVSKPIDAKRFLLTVQHALAENTTPAAPAADTFGAEHRRALSAKLVDKVRQLDEAEAALRESEARFRSLAQFSPIGIFSMTADGTLTYANPRLTEICGLSSDDVLVQWAALVEPGDRARLMCGVRSAVRTRTPVAEKMRMARSDGSQGWIKVHAAPMLDDAASPTFVGTVEDITAMVEAERHRDEMEEKLRAADRLDSLGKLAAGIAHDFNNLLSVIINYSEFVDDDLADLPTTPATEPSIERLRDDAASIRQAADSAAALTRQLLVFARRDVIRPVRMDVNLVVTSAITLLRRTVGEQVELIDDLPGHPQIVTADRAQIEQIVVNLVVNARDAVGTGGRVAVTTDHTHVGSDAESPMGPRPGDYVRISVTDDGEGMDAETMARAFEPFFTTKDTGKGTGLGLSTVYGIAKRLGGTVTLHSEPGQGTAVRVYLPAASVTAGDQPDNPDAGADAASGAGRVVLVCEDSDEIRAVAQRTLTEYGFDVLLADRGDQALHLLSSSKRVDLLLTDLVMPGMSGRELAERGRAARADLPVLFMSGYAQGVLGPVAQPDGIELLEKPFTRRQLLAAVGRAAGGYHIAAGSPGD